MPSSFTWLDYSEQERRKMLDPIRLFEDQNTVDELGIGTVRDRFADLLFPDTGGINQVLLPCMCSNTQRLAFVGLKPLHHRETTT